MRFAIPTEVLRHVREAAQVRQGALATRLGTNATFVSRLEKETVTDPEFAQRYLTAVDTDLANQVIEHYERDWRNIDPPSFLHPNREQIWRIELAMQELAGFEAGPQHSDILRPWIASLRDDLSSVLRYLERLDHTIAWIGDIGVGKTTALAHATKLLHTDGKGPPKPVFPVGSGRVTVAETKVKASPAYGVGVEAVDLDGVRALVTDFVNGFVGGGRGGGVPAEMARVLRNMSGFRTRRQPTGGDAFTTSDPIADGLAAGEQPDVLVDRMMTAMDLPNRRETSIAHPGDAEDGMAWLARTIAGINNGLDERFSVPKRITVLLPSTVLRGAGELSVVDTKGIEGVTQRSDLRDYQDDPRALMVLCTKFPDAPGQTVERLLRDQAEQGSIAVERHRVAILVLPRGDEPLQVLDQGEHPATHAEGRAIRAEEIAGALAGAALPNVPAIFFDAHRDTPESVWTSLRGRIEAMRAFHVGRLDRTARAVAELIGNVDLVKTRNARTEIERRTTLLAVRIANLTGVRRHAHLNLVEQLDIGHQSSVAAAVARGGEWPNFPIQHLLGVGVRQDAVLRSAENFGRVTHELESMRDDLAEIAGVAKVLEGLGDRVDEWRQDFLAAALEIGRDAFRSMLKDETELWRRSRERYGTYVPGYKKDLATIWREHFEGSAPDEARRAVEERLADAWSRMVVEPLLAATKAEDDA